MSNNQQEELEAAISMCGELLEIIERYKESDNRILICDELMYTLLWGPELPSYVESIKLLVAEIFLYRKYLTELSELEQKIESLKNVLASQK